METYDLFPEPQEIQRIIKTTDISDVSMLEFTPYNGDKFWVKNEKVLKIAKYINKKFGKNSFAPHELEGVFEFVIKNLNSKVDPSEYQELQKKIEEFIESGWTINFQLAPESLPKLTFWKGILIFLLSLLIVIWIFGVLCWWTLLWFIVALGSSSEMGGNPLIWLLLIPGIILLFYLIKWIYVYWRKGITYIRNK